LQAVLHTGTLVAGPGPYEGSSGPARLADVCFANAVSASHGRPGQALEAPIATVLYEQGFILSPGFHCLEISKLGQNPNLPCLLGALYLRTSSCPPPALASMEVDGEESAPAQSPRAGDASSDSDSDFEEVEASAEDMESITDLEAELSVNANLYDKHVEVRAEL